MARACGVLAAMSKGHFPFFGDGCGWVYRESMAGLHTWFVAAVGARLLQGAAMDVWRITVAAVRRWYVLVPMLALTAFLAQAAGEGVKEEYVATGAIMMVPGAVTPEVPNPYGGPSEANYAVALVVRSPDARAEVKAQGLEPTYEISPQSRSTIMTFEVRSESSARAIDTGIAVFQLAAKELRSRQDAAGISRNAQYSVDVLQDPSLTAVVTEGKMRNMAVVGALGAALSLALAVFFDDVVGLVRRWRRKKQQKRAEAAGPAEDPTAQPAESKPSAGPQPRDHRADRTGELESSAVGKAR